MTSGNGKPQPRSYDTKVECFTGRHYPDRPVAFQWEGQRLEVEEVERRWRTQEASYSSPILYHYAVRTARGRFHLVYDTDKDVWQAGPA